MAESNPNPRWLGPAIVTGILAFAAGLVYWGYTLDRPHHMGTFTATGSSLGDWTMDVDTCHNGARENFRGAQFYSTKDKRLGIWIIDDPVRGLVPSINSITTNDAINVNPANCSVLSGHQVNTSTTLRPPASIAGEYTINCTVDQSHISGHVSFDHCL